MHILLIFFCLQIFFLDAADTREPFQIRNVDPEEKIKKDLFKTMHTVTMNSDIIPTYAKMCNKGNKMIISGFGSQHRLVDMESGIYTHYVYQGPGSQAIFSPNEEKILFTENNNIHIYAVGGEKCLTYLKTLSGCTSEVRIVAWSPTGNKILTTEEDKTARVWDTQTGAQLALLGNRVNNIQTAAWNAYGDKILTLEINRSGFNNLLHIWNVQTGKEIRTIQSFICSAEWGKRSNKILTQIATGGFEIWDANTGMQLTRVFFPGVANGVLSPQEDTVLTAGERRKIEIWNTQNGKRRQELPIIYDDHFDQLKWSDCGNKIFYADNKNKSLSVFNSQNGELLLWAHIDISGAARWDIQEDMVLAPTNSKEIKLFLLPLVYEEAMTKLNSAQKAWVIWKYHTLKGQASEDEEPSCDREIDPKIMSRLTALKYNPDIANNN